MMTYDRNRNAITTGSRVMISGTGHTGIIKAIESEGLDAGQIRRGKSLPKISAIPSSALTRLAPSSLFATAR